MELAPNPISRRDYHDARLVGILPDAQRVVLILRDAAGLRVEIDMSGVRWFVATDVMVGNIIERIDLHTITPANTEAVLEALGGTKSEYFSTSSIAKIRDAGGLLGMKLLSVHPTYGSYVLGICEQVEEREG